MKLKLIGLSAFLLALAAGCVTLAPAKVLNATIPKSGFELHEQAYGNHARQRMDIYLPKQKHAGKAPILFVFGGAWRSGSKEDFLFVAEALTALGHPVIIPNYRLYPTVKYPEIIEDVAQALAHLEMNATSLLGEPLQPFILMGHSSGAHAAALLATKPPYLQKFKVKTPVKALIGLAGPYDLPLELTEVAQVFGQAKPQDVNPTLNLPLYVPPTLLLHGEVDERVLPKHSRRFAEALQQAKVSVELHIYPNVEHVRVLASLAKPLRGLNPSYRDIVTFLAKHQL
ncbi:alpha/beta hydrolase [uncultured Thiothrix sp.]|uniref:alpha/beta hydrolase n=1 Tax=uncultured Thiothrix sp. TaxID=223185 RepID=UPI00262FD132|nr:alpha/beta hydrolase [uncultured Thiothrix sp.]HMT94083.1 alpha/beta hydrolase [Thiolinea sp.]